MNFNDYEQLGLQEQVQHLKEDLHICCQRLRKREEEVRLLQEQLADIISNCIAHKEIGPFLPQSQATLEALCDSIQDFIWVVNPHGQFVRLNNAILSRLGYSANDLLSQSILKLYPLDRQREAEAWLSELLAGITHESTLPLQSQNGSQVPVVTRIIRGKWFGQEVLIGISRDITVHRQLEAQLIKSAKVASLGMMAGGIAHEIRSPLTVCSSAAQFLLEDDLDADFRRLCLEKLLAGITQASAIVENLLKFARTPEKIEVNLIELQEVIRDTLELIANKANRQNVTISQFLPDEPITLFAMPGLLSQAFLNLFLNALKAMPDGGTLRISLESDAKEAVIIIADTGHGIAAADLPNIFDPFYTTQSMGQGTGLGLAICQSFIKQHHGTIELESSVDQGATFIIKLPLKQENSF